MPRGDIQRQVLEPVPVRAPDQRADALEDRRHRDEDDDLDTDRRRLHEKGYPEEGPREEREHKLLGGCARSIER